jgi:LEA14-like dessication related protein
MIGLFWVLTIAALPASAVRIEVDPQPGRYFQAVLSGPAGQSSGGGEFRGAVALDGSSYELQLRGQARQEDGRLIVRAQIAYADVPRDWADHLRPEGFEYRIRGGVDGAEPVSWSGRLPWSAVVVAGDEGSALRFLRLTSFELTALSPRRSEGRAVLRVENPFAFPLRVAEASYELAANGRAIGRGRARGRTLRPKRASALELPFSVDQKEFLAAVGSEFVLGREVDTGLRGSLRLRLASGDVRVPIRMTGQLSTAGARSGVFAPPPGSTDLSPR